MLPKKIRTMNDLMVEKYRLKAGIAKSQGDVRLRYERLKASFTFANISDMVGEQLFPGTYSKITSVFSRFQGIWKGITAALLEKLSEKFGS